MAYASYEEYRGLYGGEKLQELEFEFYANRAGEYLELLTYGRCAQTLEPEVEAAVKKACCGIAEVLHQEQNEPEVRSHSVGAWSTTYAPAPSRERRIAEVARLYLGGSGLLWRGWRRSEGEHV